MGLNLRYSFNYEIINFLNLLTEDPFYISKGRHKDALNIYLNQYYKGDSKELLDIVKEIVEIIGSVHINTTLNSTLSLLPEFQYGDLLNLIKDPCYIKSVIEPLVIEAGMVNKQQFNDIWEVSWVKLLKKVEIILELLLSNGFKEYWEKVERPKLDEFILRNKDFYNSIDVTTEINQILGIKKYTEINAIISTFVYPRGYKLYDNTFLTDYRLNTYDFILVTIHEMFHSPYNIKNVKESIKKLSQDEYLIESYNSQHEIIAYQPFESYIEENIVDTLGLYVAKKIGLPIDPINYLKTHDLDKHGNPQCLSIIFYEYLINNEKKSNELFDDYFNQMVNTLPIGNLHNMYKEIMAKY